MFKNIKYTLLSLFVVFKHLFKRPVTLEYPEKRLKVSEKFRDSGKYFSTCFDGPTRGYVYEKANEIMKNLNENNIKTRIRQVIIPSLNDSQDNVVELVKIVSKYDCVDMIELLPFKNICQVKYDEMKIKFPLEKTPNMDVEVTANMQVIANELLKMYRESR